MPSTSARLEQIRQAHTEAWYAEATASERGKVCARCDQWKHFREFHRAPERSDGFTSWCAPCRVASVKRTMLKRVYGLSEEDYLTLRGLQGSRCAICGTHEDIRPLVVDHCHDTGKVRGLLCHQCNVGLGYLQESADCLVSALRYLARDAGFDGDDSSLGEFLSLVGRKANNGEG
jgi:hypothetical protein